MGTGPARVGIAATVVGADAAAFLANASSDWVGAGSSGVVAAGRVATLLLDAAGGGVAVLTGAVVAATAPLPAVLLEPPSPPPHATTSTAQPRQANEAVSRLIKALICMRKKYAL
jgi:hypothetical protein